MRGRLRQTGKYTVPRSLGSETIAIVAVRVVAQDQWRRRVMSAFYALLAARTRGA
jgi:hypothetical protein